MSREMNPQNLPPADFKALSESLENALLACDPTHQNVICDLLQSALKLATETHEPHDLTLISSTLKELRRSFKLFSPYRDIRKVCLFGSARTPEDDPNYILAHRYSELITQKGWMVITGAGPGIMEAGNKGALPDTSFGVNINLPFEQHPNPYIANSSKLTSFKYFFNRKVSFLRESDATVLFPGGFGTHDEGFEVLTLLQTGRCAPRPLILVAHENDPYWEKWVNFIQTELCDPGYISPEDMHLFTRTDSAEEAVQQTQDFYRVFHSIRYFNDMAVIRLNQRLTASDLKAINSQFKDLCTDGQFELSDPDQFTLDRNDFNDKNRLIFKFDKMSYGRLCGLIRFINTL
jgi:uncharacterized protein (TIGR00730 family)